MKVLVVEPGYEPYEKEINGLPEMQAVVGGLITVSYPFEEQVGLVSNDESLLMGLPFNRSVEGGYGGIFGPFFVCGLSGSDFCSLTPEQMERYKQKYHMAESLIALNGNTPITIKTEPLPKEREEKRPIRKPRQRPKGRDR